MTDFVIENLMHDVFLFHKSDSAYICTNQSKENQLVIIQIGLTQ